MNFLYSLPAYLPAGAWDLNSFLNNVKQYARQIAAPALGVLGVVLLAYAGYKIFRAIMGRAGSEGPEWGKAILALIFGGALLFGSYTLMESIGRGGLQTVNKFGGNVLVPFQPVIEMAKMWLG